MSPQVQVVLIAAGCTGSVGCIGVGALWLLRRASLRLLLQVSSAIGVLAVVAGTLGTANAMFISHHDLGVVFMVCLVAGLVAVGFSWLLGRQIEQSSLALRQATRSLGQGGGEFTAPAGPMAAELAALSRELDATAAKLRESRDRERRMEQSRRRLIAWVSHDLRTPLAGLRAMAESLEDGIATDTGRYHRQMRAEVTRLSAMVDDLFELSRIESGTLTLSPDEVEVGDLVSDAVAGMEAVARERSVRLTGEADGPLVIQADPRKLSRALSNLLANAVRHTPAGGRVHVAATAAGGGVVMTVADGCGGIADDDLARVFDPSWRGTAARTPGADSGAGLGLAIVRGIVEAHQGQVSVVNAGYGCRFEMRLPLPVRSGNGAGHSADHAAVDPVGARPAGSLIPDS
jgi:signal transduction histidine kinase